MKIVIGGQVEKQAIAELVLTAIPNCEIEILSDLDAAMALKQNKAEYYLGACHTGGGAVAMAVALLGMDKAKTIAAPGKPADEADVAQLVQKGVVAFGFAADQMQSAVGAFAKAVN